MLKSGSRADKTNAVCIMSEVPRPGQLSGGGQAHVLALVPLAQITITETACAGFVGEQCDDAALRPALGARLFRHRHPPAIGSRGDAERLRWLPFVHRSSAAFSAPPRETSLAPSGEELLHHAWDFSRRSSNAARSAVRLNWSRSSAENSSCCARLAAPRVGGFKPEHDLNFIAVPPIEKFEKEFRVPLLARRSPRCILPRGLASSFGASLI
jgi:hypothetical protein